MTRMMIVVLLEEVMNAAAAAVMIVLRADGLSLLSTADVGRLLADSDA